jgi:hypothetical protein
MNVFLTGVCYKILSAFSFNRNWKSLMKNCIENTSPDYMPGIQGLRTLFTFLIISSHIYFFMYTEKNGWLSQVGYNGWLKGLLI